MKSFEYYITKSPIFFGSHLKYYFYYTIIYIDKKKNTIDITLHNENLTENSDLDNQISKSKDINNERTRDHTFKM
jgi:hypothetical protein